jgi:polysaccharide biosynthesis protein VpsQ
MSSKASRWGWRISATIYLVIFIVILVLAYTGQLPASFFTQYDKVGHLVLYGLATYLGQKVFNFRQIRLQTIAIPLFPLLFGMFTIVEELLQSLSPNRSLDGLDLIASFFGIVLGYWLAEKGRH